MNIIDAIRVRRSVRDFQEVDVPQSDIESLREAIATSSSPFGGRIEIFLEKFDLKGPQKPGTYGVIKGASWYLLMAVGEGREALLSAGFRMEQVVLRATESGLGTCWMGGTFKGSDFGRRRLWNEALTLRIISPVGIPARSKSLLARLTSFVAGSAGRKDFASLFTNAATGEPLRGDSPFGQSLELMRLAPSSLNSQPWRAIVDGGTVHFYTKGLRDMNFIDCGIALYHFYAGESAASHPGEFVTIATHPTPSGLTYLTSWQSS